MGMDVVRKRLKEFFFPAIADTWLVFLRVGLGVQVILYCVSVRSDWNKLFALNGGGFITRDLTEAILAASSSFIPRLGWLVTLGKDFGLGEQTVISGVWICLFCAGCCLVSGLFSRIAAILAWFLYLSAEKTGELLMYGVDHCTTIGLFYLMLSPLPDRSSLDSRWRNLPLKDPQLLGLFRRVLQLHLCVIYFSGGVTKCLGIGWWTGESMWRALTRPPFNVIPADVIVSWKAALPFVGIAVCILETGYPFFIWWKRTRFIWLVCILLMHAAIGITMGLYLFSLIMFVLNLAAFGPNTGRTQGTTIGPGGNEHSRNCPPAISSRPEAPKVGSF
jgi:hypothetical protein